MSTIMLASLGRLASKRSPLLLRGSSDVSRLARAYSSIEKAEFSSIINDDKDVLSSDKVHQDHSLEDAQPMDEISKNNPNDQIVEAEANIEESVPWYLRDAELSSDVTETTPIDLPALPQHAPASVSDFLNLLSVDYGLENIELFDLTTLDETHDYHTSKQPAEYIIICTGKSEKHIFKAANELRTNIKHNRDHLPSIEGMVNSTQSPKARRRMLRRARKGPSATDNDYGKAPNSWVMCDTFVDNIFIHILTSQRREELNLESLWCKPEDLPRYTPQRKLTDDSDDIFIGIRRYHTTTPFARMFQQSTRRYLSTSAASSNTKLQDHYKKLCSKDFFSLSSGSTKGLVTEFDLSFSQTIASLNDHNTRRDFYKLVHLVDPEVVTFDQVVDSIIQKYNALSIALDESVDLSAERILDVTQYMSLLIDSPTVKQQASSAKITSDILYHKLSKFISVLYRFSNDKFSLSANSKLIPLLWKLAFVSNSQSSHQVLGSEQVDKVINEEIPIPVLASEPTNELASNRARDVLSLIAYENGSVTNEKPLIPTQRYREMLLFTYGNAGNWERFWKEWNSSFNLFQAMDSKAKSPQVENWTRLAVYLAARNNKAQILHFFNNHWDVNSSLIGSFLSAYSTNNRQFNSDGEKRAFVSAVKRMLVSISNGSGATVYPQIAEFIKSV